MLSIQWALKGQRWKICVQLIQSYYVQSHCVIYYECAYHNQSFVTSLDCDPMLANLQSLVFSIISLAVRDVSTTSSFICAVLQMNLLVQFDQFQFHSIWRNFLLPFCDTNHSQLIHQTSINPNQIHLVRGQPSVERIFAVIFCVHVVSLYFWKIRRDFILPNPKTI